MDLIKFILTLCSMWTLNVTMAYPHVLKNNYKKNDSKKMLGSKIMNESYCVTSDTCPSGYVCNQSTHHCSEAKTVDDVMSKQSCRNVFKDFCTKDSQCACADAYMSCKQNECVYKKDRPKKEDGEACTKTNECDSISECTNGVCRQMSMDEMMAMLFGGNK